MKKILVIGLMMVGLAGALWWKQGTWQQKLVPSPSPLVQTKSETVVVDFGDGRVDRTEIVAVGSLSAYGMLESIAHEKQWELNTQKYDFGVFVKSVNGYESGAERAWIYFVNGQPGDIAADQYVTKPGDTVEWKYVKPSD